MVDNNQIDEELLGDLAIEEVIEAVSGLVSGEMRQLQGLGDDADINEEILRATVQNAAIKAFYVGLFAGGARSASTVGDEDLVVYMDSSVIERIGLNVIRDGSLTLHLLPKEGE